MSRQGLPASTNANPQIFTAAECLSLPKWITSTSPSREYASRYLAVHFTDGVDHGRRRIELEIFRAIVGKRADPAVYNGGPWEGWRTVALSGTIPLASPKVTEYSIRRQPAALLLTVQRPRLQKRALPPACGFVIDSLSAPPGSCECPAPAFICTVHR